MPSRVIQWMRYDAEEQVLVIVYRGGRGTYRYFDVPTEEWEAFRAAGSKGTYLNEVFKVRKYRYQKLKRNEDRRSGEVASNSFWGER